MRVSRAQEGCLPTEIYAEILTYVTDLGTRHSCVDVSKTDGPFADSDDSPTWFEVYDVPQPWFLR